MLYSLNVQYLLDGCTIVLQLSQYPVLIHSGADAEFSMSGFTETWQDSQNVQSQRNEQLVCVFTCCLLAATNRVENDHCNIT